MLQQPRYAVLEDADDERLSPRRKLRLGVRWTTQRQDATDAVVHDLSEDGLLLEVEAPLALGEMITINLPSIREIEAEVVWNSGRLHGCKFSTPMTKGIVSSVLLRSGYVGDAGGPVAPFPREEALTAPSLYVSPPDGGEGPLSPRAKLVATFGMTLASWAFVGAIAYALHLYGDY